MASSTQAYALLRNEVGSKRNWLAVELVGTKSNRDAVGARVSIEVKGRPQMREVVLGDGHEVGEQSAAAGNISRLNDAAAVDEMVVKWPRSGIVQKFSNVAANRIVQVTEGSDALVEKKYARK